MILQSEREHRRLKTYYARTNKNKFTRQCAHHERRERILRGIRSKEKEWMEHEQVERGNHIDGAKEAHLSFEQADPLPQTLPHDHVHISKSKKHCVDLRQFVNERRNDPAFHVSFIRPTCCHEYGIH